METISLHATRRDILGKKVKQLRRQGLVPLNLFGHNVPSTALQADARQMVQVLRTAGTHALVNLAIDNEAPKAVLVRGFAADPMSGHLLHVDLYQVGMKEKLKAEVPLDFVGEAPAVSTAGGILVRGATAVEIESLPKDLPASIPVDLTGLTELDSAVRVRDLNPPPGVKILTDPDEVVARVAAPRVERGEEEAAPAAPAREGEATETEAAS